MLPRGQKQYLWLRQIGKWSLMKFRFLIHFCTAQAHMTKCFLHCIGGGGVFLSCPQQWCVIDYKVWLAWITLVTVPQGVEGRSYGYFALISSRWLEDSAPSASHYTDALYCFTSLRCRGDRKAVRAKSLTFTLKGITSLWQRLVKLSSPVTYDHARNQIKV